MTDTEMEILIATSFLARVPALMIGGMSLEDAIVEAKRQDDWLLIRLQNALHSPNDSLYAAEHEALATMTRDVYRELSVQPATEQVNTRHQIFLSVSQDQSRMVYMTWVADSQAEYSKETGIYNASGFTKQQHADFDAWLQEKYRSK